MVQHCFGASKPVSFPWSFSCSPKPPEHSKTRSVAHVASSYVPDTAFDDEADLIVWGHEHDCVNKAQACSVPGRRYYITQPGSSIATSLAKGEAIPKYVPSGFLFFDVSLLTLATLLLFTSQARLAPQDSRERISNGSHSFEIRSSFYLGGHLTFGCSRKRQRRIGYESQGQPIPQG